RARLARMAGEHAQAVAHADKARRELRRYTRSVLPALSEHEQLEFLGNREARSLHEALATALEAGADRAAVETAAAWVLNGKGLAQEAVAQRTLLARGTTDPRLAAVTREWLAIRYRLAKLSLADSGSVTSPEARNRELAALTAREQSLAAQLGRSSAQEDSKD